MTTILKDYQLSVLETYRRRVKAKAVSSNLLNPTPASLRNECVIVCRERLTKEDEQIFRDFFGQNCNSLKDRIGVIEKTPPNNFKPLQYFIQEKTQLPAIKIVNLLAWLIDYGQRPFDSDRPLAELPPLAETGEIEEEVPAELVKEACEEEVLVTEAKEISGLEVAAFLRRENLAEEEKAEETIVVAIPEKKPRIRRMVMVGVSVILLSALFYLGYNASGMRGCMYWAGDHFERVPCNQKGENISLVELDEEKLAHFKKINRKDTITHQSIGWVWYDKRNNEDSVECFTAAGFNPAHSDRRLRPITDYIINRYIRNKK